MSEEVKDAGRTVARAIIGGDLLNGAFGIVFLVTYVFMITDLDATLNHDSGHPHIWVFLQAVPRGGAVILNIIPMVLIFAGTLSFNLSTSRCTWAFARDEGLPLRS